jgi:hypothetical protein
MGVGIAGLGTPIGGVGADELPCGVAGRATGGIGVDGGAGTGRTGAGAIGAVGTAARGGISGGAPGRGGNPVEPGIPDPLPKGAVVRGGIGGIAGGTRPPGRAGVGVGAEEGDGCGVEGRGGIGAPNVPDGRENGGGTGGAFVAGGLADGTPNALDEPEGRAPGCGGRGGVNSGVPAEVVEGGAAEPLRPDAGGVAAAGVARVTGCAIGGVSALPKCAAAGAAAGVGVRGRVPAGSLDLASRAMVITPPQTAQRARTDAPMMRLGSTRNTERHSGQVVFMYRPAWR